MRVGIVGLHDGHIQGMIASAYESADAEIIGVVEPDDRVYGRYENIRRFHSMDELLEDGKPELILEGLNHAEKTPVVEKAAEHGVHLICDKPLCHSMTDWQRMKDAVESAGVTLTMWLTSRRHPPFVALRDQILQGELGELVSLISTHPHMLGPGSPDWYFDPAVYTGVFHDLASHGVDQVRYLTGAEYTSVHAIAAQKKYRGMTIPDHVQASFRLSNDACAVVTADWLTPKSAPSFGDTRFIIMGTKGSAHLRAYAADHLLVVTDKGSCEPDLSQIRLGPYVQEVIEAVERGEQPSISTEDAFAVTRACLLAQASVEQDGKVIAL